MFFNNKFSTFFGLNLTLVYTFPMCMAWRFHFPIRNYDFKSSKSNSGKGFKSLLQWHSEEMHTVAGEECDYAKVGHKSGIVGGTGNYLI